MRKFRLTDVAAFAGVRAVLLVGPFRRLDAPVAPIVRVVVARAVVPAGVSAAFQVLDRVCCQWYETVDL